MTSTSSGMESLTLVLSDDDASESGVTAAAAASGDDSPVASTSHGGPSVDSNRDHVEGNQSTEVVNLSDDDDGVNDDPEDELMSQQKRRFHFLEDKFFKLKSAEAKEGRSDISLVFTCLQCRSSHSLTSAALSNLRRHMNRKHTELVSQFDSVWSQNKKKQQSESDIKSTQKKLQDFFNRDKSLPLPFNQGTLDEAIVDFVITTNQAFKIVETKDFRRLVLLGRGEDFKVMTSKTLKKHLDSRFDLMSKKMKEDMAATDWVCLTADLWSGANRGFLGVTCHWLNDDLTRKSVALAVRRIITPHSFGKLAKEIESITIQFGIQNKCRGTVTDGGKNFLKAFGLFGDNEDDETANDSESEELESDEEPTEETVDVGAIFDADDGTYSLPSHLRCGAHLMDNIAKVDADPSKMGAQLKKVWRSFDGKAQALFNKQGMGWTGSVKACDTIRSHIGRLFIKPNKTRWNTMFNSYQLLLDVITKKRDKVDAMMDDLGLIRFSTDDIEFLKDYCKVFEPFARALNVLQKEKNGYVGVLLPILVKTKERLNIEGRNSRFCWPLVDKLVQGIDTRFINHFNNDDLYVAAALHPMWKLDWVDSATKKTEIWDLIRNEILQMQDHDPVPAKVRKQSNPGAGDIEWFFPGAGASQTSQTDILDTYIAQPAGGKPQDLHRYPVLLKLFRKFNVMLPASAAVERLFTHGGDVLCRKRQSMNDKNFEKKVLLKVNMM